MTDWRGRVEQVIAPSLIERVPRDHEQSDREFRRRRTVVAVALVVGTSLLAVSLSIRPGDPSFYYLSLTVALVWLVGGCGSGPLHLGYLQFRGEPRRPVVIPIIAGLVAGLVFILGAFVVREIAPLRHDVETIVAHAQQGSTALIALVTLVNGAAEEVFFRGGLFAAIGRKYPVAISTVIYAAVTTVTGNPMLVFAAVTLGLVLALQRRASGGILAPMLTHVTWSTMMVFLLPLLFPR
ncbi:MAG: CPBP family intramembrane glutamic endopeptidase [Frankia sp.]